MKYRTKKPDNGKSGTNRTKDWKAYWENMKKLTGGKDDSRKSS